MNISVKNCSPQYYPDLAHIGYCGVDFSFGGYDLYEEMMAPEYASKIKARQQAILDAGLTVCQTHISYRPSRRLPPDGGNYPDYAKKMLPLFEKQLRITADMGCRVAVFHPYYELASQERSRQGNLQLLETLMPLLEQTGIVLSLENVYGPNCVHAHHSTAEDLLFYTEHFDSPHIGICLDTGHAVIRNQDPVQMLRLVSHRLTAVHLHSTLPGHDLHTIPYFTNQAELIDWETFYQVLRQTPYSGPFNLELKLPPTLSLAAVRLFYQTAYTVARDIMASQP